MISEFVVAPSGGIVFEREPGVNCDGIFREQLMINRTASTPTRMQFLVQRIQSRFEECNVDFWAPKVREEGHFNVSGCYDRRGGDEINFIAGVEIPKGLIRDEGGDRYRPSRRDARNNIIVHFNVLHPLPSDGLDLLDVRQLPGELGGGVFALIFSCLETQKHDLVILF